MFWFAGSWTEQEFLGLRPEFPGFARVAAYRPEGATLEMPGEGLRMVEGISATAELFDVLGATPMLGPHVPAGRGPSRRRARRRDLATGCGRSSAAEAAIVGRPAACLAAAAGRSSA